MSYDARHPDTPAHGLGGKPAQAHLTAAHLRPDVLHKVGETYAVALSRLQRQLAGEPGAERLQLALAEVARLERLGVQIQEIARVLAGEGVWVTERVDLAGALRQVAGAWADKAALAGAALTVQPGDGRAELNPAVFEQLLELGVEYALHMGQRIELRCGEDGNPPVPTVSFAITRSAAHRSADQADDVNDLQWLLFVTLARASGLAPQRQVVGDMVHLRLGLAEPSDDRMASAALLPTTPVAVGRRVLLIEPQEAVRLQAQQLLHNVGMVVDAAPTVDLVRASLGTSVQAHLPDVLVTGVPAEQPACTALIDELRERQPGLRVVELVDDDSAFAFSVPGTELPARVGRRTLARTLVSAISQELDAV